MSFSFAATSRRQPETSGSASGCKTREATKARRVPVPGDIDVAGRVHLDCRGNGSIGQHGSNRTLLPNTGRVRKDVKSPRPRSIIFTLTCHLSSNDSKAPGLVAALANRPV